jgi:hypothetical protein
MTQQGAATESGLEIVKYARAIAESEDQQRRVALIKRLLDGDPADEIALDLLRDAV